MARPISQQIIECMSTQQTSDRVCRCDLVLQIKIHFHFDNHIGYHCKTITKY